MKLILPENVSRIIDTLMRAGYEAYAVGGCIRDSLLGREPKDWDITTSASPAEVKALFPKTVDTGIAHGTVTVLLNREGFEVTTYRVDGTYEDFRHPKEVTFTPDLNEDLKRRDFTINAMAYNDTHGLIDAFDGAADLDRKIVRCVGAPKERFSEDALRMMRAVRFGAQLGFTVEEQTRSAICALAPTLKKISAERIQSELVSLLMSDHPEEMRTLYETGITKVILPEFDVMMQTAQNSPHHMYTVGEHTIQSLAQIESKKTLRLAMLFHDIGKPSCKTTGEDGQDHFYGHPQKGSEMARSIMRRLKFDNDTTQKVCCLVAGHDQNPPITERSVRRAAVSLGSGAFPDIFAVKRADILAQSDYQRSEKLAYVDQYEACYRSVIEKNQCLSLKDLAVSGRDLIAAGMRPGPALGNVLNRLFELVLDDPDKNETGYLLRMAREFAAGESA
ncbi:CCA-adding enzyme [Lachnospiraceae bacterium]|nr:CCA tRNA nucleotidyltransferase [Eubacterium sp.]GFI26493.1 CCA-adding enzyme [Lachnospiraceae bacterium]